MAKKDQKPALAMTNLNAEITVETMDLLRMAKILHKRPLRDLVQEAIDEWLRAKGITADRLAVREDKRRVRDN